MYSQIIGIVGGFGAYATLNFYKRILEVFASDCERNYPHIIMDNNFTMPSRTRALLYGECYTEIVQEIAKSIKILMEQGADRIILVCGTAHYFLKDVYQLLPEAKDCIVDIIDVLGENVQEEGVKDLLIIAAEGTLKKGLYSERLQKYNINCICPQADEYEEIRYFIECVKKNQFDSEVAERFCSFLEKYAAKNVVLGCTEFPVLVENIKKQGIEMSAYTFWDPVELVIAKLKQEMV